MSNSETMKQVTKALDDFDALRPSQGPAYIHGRLMGVCYGVSQHCTPDSSDELRDAILASALDRIAQAATRPDLAVQYSCHTRALALAHADDDQGTVWSAIMRRVESLSTSVGLNERLRGSDAISASAGFAQQLALNDHIVSHILKTV